MNITIPLMRYALEVFIPAASRYLVTETCVSKKRTKKLIFMDVTMLKIRGYHLKLIPGVVVSEIRTM